LFFTYFFSWFFFFDLPLWHLKTNISNTKNVIIAFLSNILI
jgi:hypothetical protein